MKTKKDLYPSDGTTASQLPPPTPLSSSPDTATPAASPTPGTSDEGPQQQIVMELHDAEVCTQQELSTDTDPQGSDDEVQDSQDVDRLHRVHSSRCRSGHIVIVSANRATPKPFSSFFGGGEASRASTANADIRLWCMTHRAKVMFLFLVALSMVMFKVRVLRQK